MSEIDQLLDEVNRLKHLEELARVRADGAEALLIERERLVAVQDYTISLLQHLHFGTPQPRIDDYTPPTPHEAEANDTDARIADQTAQAVRMRREGTSVEDIARELGVSSRTVYRYLSNALERDASSAATAR